MKSIVNLSKLSHFLSETLQPQKFSDYCPNGLQIEGKLEIKKVVTGVTASMAFLNAAHIANADAVLVHHGYFWRGENPAITGIKKRRIQFLLQNEISLFGYHLPLDTHPDFGNNVMLGKQLGFKNVAWLDDKQMVAWAELSEPQTLQNFATFVSGKLGRRPQVIGDIKKDIKTVAWCTGAAQSYIEQAIAANIDVYISGEISEQTVHLARESGTAYIAAGHHATERYGIEALGQCVAQNLDLEHEFIDIENPV
jgi:dinuclear metal center YbgI/SA1388 family protein